MMTLVLPPGLVKAALSDGFAPRASVLALADALDEIGDVRGPRVRACVELVMDAAPYCRERACPRCGMVAYALGLPQEPTAPWRCSRACGWSGPEADLLPPLTSVE